MGSPTGNTREIAGYQTRELVLRMEMQATGQKSGQQGSMVISSDIWLAPSVAGYQEVRAFYTRMGDKLAFNPGGALGGALGGRFGLGRKKQQQDDQASTGQPSQQQQGNGNPGSLMEATTEMSGFSSGPVDDSTFAVPAGFKKVENRKR